MIYTIGEIAKKFNLPTSTLRYYDKEGLLPDIERSDGGKRVFKDSDYETLSLIECLKKTGMPIKDIKIFIDWCIEGDTTIDKRLELIKKQQKSVEKQIAQLEETLNFIKYKSWYYETAKSAGTCTIHQNIKKEDIPAEFQKTFLKIKGY